MLVRPILILGLVVASLLFVFGLLLVPAGDFVAAAGLGFISFSLMVGIPCGVILNRLEQGHRRRAGAGSIEDARKRDELGEL